MAGMIGWLKHFGADESGQDLVEYALIVAVLGLGAIATLKGVALYGLVYRDTAPRARAFLDELGNPYSRIDLDGDGRAGIEWGVYGVPETFIIDGKGIVRLRYPGPIVGSALTDTILPAIERAQNQG